MYVNKACDIKKIYKHTADQFKKCQRETQELDQM